MFKDPLRQYIHLAASISSINTLIHPSLHQSIHAICKIYASMIDNNGSPYVMHIPLLPVVVMCSHYDGQNPAYWHNHGNDTYRPDGWLWKIVHVIHILDY